MKNTMKKYVIDFLCLVFVLCASIPAFAFAGNQNQYEHALRTRKGYGVLSFYHRVDVVHHSP